MAKMEHIEATDFLNQGREKINKSIDFSGEAHELSIQADKKSDNAQNVSHETKKRLDNVLAGEMDDGEVIDARRGFDVLSDHLKFLQDAKSLDYYIGNPDKLPEMLSSIEVFGFYEAESEFENDAKKIKYLIKDLEGTENFTLINGFYELSDNLEIKIGEKKAVPVIGKFIKGQSIGLGGRDDTKAFQILMDYAFNNHKNVDLRGTIVTIDGTVDLKKTQYPRDLLIVRGGKLIKKSEGFMFTSNINDMSGGGYKFINTVFEGMDRNFNDYSEIDLEKAIMMTVFDSRIIRLYLESCEFYNVDTLMKSIDNKYFGQTVYLTNVHVVGGLGNFIDIHNAYDVSISQCVIEHRWNFMNIRTTNSVRVINNVIEGLNGYVLYSWLGRGLEFSGNYIEANCRASDKPYMQFERTANQSQFSVSITKNLFQDNPGDKERLGDYRLIKFISAPNAFDISANWFDRSFIEISNEATITNKLIRNLMTNQANGNVFLMNNWKVTDVLEGGVPLNELNGKSVVGDVTAMGGITITKPQQGLRIPALGNGKGFTTTKNFQIQPVTPYVLGFRVGGIFSKTNEGFLSINFQKYSGDLIELRRIPLQFVNQFQWYTTPCYVSDNTNDAFKVVFKVVSGEIDFILMDMRVQQGTIAN